MTKNNCGCEVEETICNYRQDSKDCQKCIKRVHTDYVHTTHIQPVKYITHQKHHVTKIYEPEVYEDECPPTEKCVYVCKSEDNFDYHCNCPEDVQTKLTKNKYYDKYCKQMEEDEDENDDDYEMEPSGKFCHDDDDYEMEPSGKFCHDDDEDEDYDFLFDKMKPHKSTKFHHNKKGHCMKGKSKHMRKKWGFGCKGTGKYSLPGCSSKGSCGRKKMIKGFFAAGM